MLVHSTAQNVAQHSYMDPDAPETYLADLSAMVLNNSKENLFLSLTGI